MTPAHLPREPKNMDDLRSMEMEAYDKLPTAFRMAISASAHVPFDISLVTLYVMRHHKSLNPAQWLMKTLDENKQAAREMYKDYSWQNQQNLSVRQLR